MLSGVYCFAVFVWAREIGLVFLCHRLNCDYSLCGVMGSVLMCIFSVDQYIQ